MKTQSCPGFQRFRITPTVRVKYSTDNALERQLCLLATLQGMTLCTLQTFRLSSIPAAVP